MNSLQPDFSDEEIAFTFDSDLPTKPYSEASLDEVIHGKTRRERFNESWSEWGWKFLVATGTIAVTAAGLRYFKKEHPDEVDED
jgi:hypothetical protein